MTSADFKAPGPEDSSKKSPDFREVAKRSAEAGIADELNQAYERGGDADPAGQGEGKSAERPPESGSAE
jgi:hypothetical protein